LRACCGSGVSIAEGLIRDIIVGGGGRAMTGFKKLAPGTFDRLGAVMAGQRW
jgi:hypothetical protein